MPKKKSLFKLIYTFFDKEEDSVRGYLSKRPITYALVAGVAVVLFWRGVWMTADLFAFLTGPISIVISLFIMLMSGVFVSFFVGDMIIISGLKKDKKVIDKTSEELEKESKNVERIENKLDDLEDKVEELLAEHEKNHTRQPEQEKKLDFSNKPML